MTLHPSDLKTQDVPASPKTEPADTYLDPNSQNQSGESSEENDLENVEQQPALGSEMMARLLDSIYEKQLACDAITRQIHCVLANYQALLRFSAPILVSDYVYEKCSTCVGENISLNCLCKHEIPVDLSLCDLWKWYKEPGIYGLEVNIEDIELRLQSSDQPTKVYFAACISAIQLFEYSKQYDEDKPASASSLPFSSDDGKLVFELFENEWIGDRQPIRDRIKKLIKDGPSNPEIYGDPSKLKTMKLRDIHPASWFAVSWKEIYQIPYRGRSKAYFLTYHSLGYLVHENVSFGSISSKIKSCIISPALGMEFSNAEDEDWFKARILDDYIPRELEPFDFTKFILEHHISLWQIARYYSTASVSKNGVKVVNKHRDYEYFTSDDNTSSESLYIEEMEKEWI